MLLIPALVYLVFDPARSVVLFTAAIVLLAAALAFGIVAVLFPSVGLDRTLRRSHDSPMGAALVFFAMLWIIGKFAEILVGMLR